MLKLFLNLCIAAACTILFGVIIVAWFLLSTPRPDDVKSCFTTELFKVELCPGKPSYVPLSRISPHMRNAVIASEDTTFWQHQGLDFHELQKSFEKNLAQGRFARGGSTITQQLAKNLYLSSEKSLLRKAREAVIAIQLEKILSKEEILEKYLNVVEFGDGIFGVKQAASVYFGKAPSELTAVDSAFLAFLLPNPKKYSVSFKKKQLTPFARREIKNILSKLHYFKKISAEEYAAALSQVEHMWSPAPAMEGEEEYTPSDSVDISPPVTEEESVTEPTPEIEIPAAEELQNELDNATPPVYEE